MKYRVGALAVPAIAAVAAVAIMASACTDLPDVADGICGNRVLDPGEDCDGASSFDGATCGAPDPGASAANACHYTCDQTACPAGWGCGTDLRCRAPGGAFQEGPEASFPVLDFAAGDVDGDGLNDLIGHTATTITVLYGTDTGELPTAVNVSTRFPTGAITFASFDSGDTLDAVVPTDLGLFTLLGQPDRSLLPFAYAPFEIPQGGTLKALSIEAESDADAELVIIGGSRLQLFDDDSTAIDLPLDRANPPVRHRAEQIPGRIPEARLGAKLLDDVPDNEQDPTTEFALSFSDDNRVWIYTSQDDQPGTQGGVHLVELEIVYLNAADVTGTCVGPQCIDAVQLGVDFGDVDGDGDLDLLISGRQQRPGGTRQVTMMALNDGDPAGGFFPDVAQVHPLIPLQIDGDPLSDQLWPIEVADLGGDFRADYVFPSFIGITADSASNALHVQPVAFALGGAWNEALAIDVNADRKLDIVTSVEGDAGIDVFINTGALLFNTFSVDTADPVAGVRGGDFDGDLVGDVALIEKPAGEDADRVSVVFGTAFGAPSPPVSMGSFDRITVLETTFFFLGFESLDLISDLVVISDSVDDQGNPSRAAALLQGSSARRMLSPFSLQVAGGAPDRPVAAVVGEFSQPADGILDVMAVGQYELAAPTGEDELRSRLYRIPGKGGDGNLDTASQQVLELPVYEEFDASCAAIAAGDIDPGGATGGGIDEVVAIDGADFCFGGSFSPSGRLIIGRIGDGIASELIQLGTDYSNVRSVRLADLDGDGDNDLVALFVGAFRDRLQDGIKPAVVVFWNQEGQFADDTGHPLETTVVPAGDKQLFHDVDLITADGTGLPQLAVLSTSFGTVGGGNGVSATASLAAIDPESKRSYGPWRPVTDGSDGRMAAADMNGDGLEDLAIMTGLDVIVWLQTEAPPLGGDLFGIEPVGAPEMKP